MNKLIVPALFAAVVVFIWRLESLAEVGGILMAHETHSLVKDTVLAEEGDTLTVKSGRNLSQ